jgi:hypothetical protein
MSGRPGGTPADKAASWSHRISKADRPGLVALVTENLARFGERDVLQVLRHPHLSELVLTEILQAKAFVGLRSVRRALALHPATPRPDALRCLDDLTWRDLVLVSRETRTPPPVRQAANRKLLDALRRLSKGEKVALARLADRDLLVPLLEENDRGVLEALLRNSRLTTDDLVRWITVGRAEAGTLEDLASDPAWSRRPPVREALLRHKLLPRGAALSLLLSATRAEWLRLAEDETIHPLLSGCARRLCESGADFVDSPGRRGLT